MSRRTSSFATGSASCPRAGGPPAAPTDPLAGPEEALSIGGITTSAGMGARCCSTTVAAYAAGDAGVEGDTTGAGETSTGRSISTAINAPPTFVTVADGENGAGPDAVSATTSGATVLGVTPVRTAVDSGELSACTARDADGPGVRPAASACARAAIDTVSAVGF